MLRRWLRCQCAHIAVDKCHIYFVNDNDALKWQRLGPYRKFAAMVEQGHRTSSCTSGKDLQHERVVPAGCATLDTQAGVLRALGVHQIHRQPPQQRDVLCRVA